MSKLIPRLMKTEAISQTLEKNYMPYAMSVIVSRAIPEIDGFKPSHRKLLYTMYKMGLLTSSRTKSANVVGQTMKLNPHGDAAIYETMVRLTKGNEALLHPYIDSKGNFGKQYSRDMQYAASRYTEVKLAEICGDLFHSIDKNVVQMLDNYDGTLKEPALLPVRFPSILVNANQGIAVGMASNICPFNLKEVCDATAAYIKNPDLEFSELLNLMPAPDFPGGGLLIYDYEQMKSIYESGRGSFKLRATYKYDKKNNLIEINEIPYTTTVEAIIDTLSDLIKNGKIKEISDVRDETDLGGLKLTIELKKSADPDKLMQKLYTVTPLESSFSCNFNIMYQNRASQMSIKDILQAWCNFRLNCYKAELSFDLKKMQDKLHLLLGLENIILDIDKAIKIIRETEKDSEVIDNLCMAFAIDEIQAEFIADIRLRQLNKEYLLNKLEEKHQLVKSIADINQRINSPALMKQDIIQQLEEISKKYVIERKTFLSAVEETQILTKDDLVEDYKLKIFVTNHAYFKKIPLISLRNNSEIKTKEDDDIKQIFDLSNKDEILIFSDKFNCYKLQLPEVTDCKPGDWGDFLPVLLDFEENENFVKLFPSYNYQGYFIFAYENGKLCKVPMSSYYTKQKRKKLIKSFSDSDKLVDILYVDELDNSDILLLSSNNRAMLINSSLISQKQSRSSLGVQVLNLRKNAKLQSVYLARNLQLNNMERYRALCYPLAGAVFKENTLEDKQLSLI